MPGLSSQAHSSLSAYAPPSEPLAFNEEEGLGAEDIFSMCSIMCFIPWRSFLVIPGSTGDGSVDDDVEPVQEFQEIRTTVDDTQENITAPQSTGECASYQPVPLWKQKYISRKSRQEQEAIVQGGGLSDSESSKRTTLEETLDRCRQIDTISDSVSETDSVSDITDGEGEGSSASWSMASFFRMSNADSSSSGSVATVSSYTVSSLYSALVGSTENRISGPSSTSSVDHSYDSILPSPVSHKGKFHRRQLSPSGVMDYVE
mmetsp:Transcript_12303/g.20025  ORF Transcript_12303/g.20025 Transcript_12303/m.20025 type:complete len:260 (+) Transcript_12303:144-923(+)